MRLDGGRLSDLGGGLSMRRMFSRGNVDEATTSAAGGAARLCEAKSCWSMAVGATVDARVDALSGLCEPCLSCSKHWRFFEQPKGSCGVGQANRFVSGVVATLPSELEPETCPFVSTQRRSWKRA